MTGCIHFTNSIIEPLFVEEVGGNELWLQQGGQIIVIPKTAFATLQLLVETISDED